MSNRTHAPRQRPFLFWLVVVQMLAVLPLLGVAAAAVYALGKRHEAEAIDGLQRRVAIAADAVARQADAAKMRLRLLSTQSGVHEADLVAMERFAASLTSTDLAIVGIAAADAHRQSLFSTSSAHSRGSVLPSLDASLGPHGRSSDVAVGGLALDDAGQQILPFVAPWTYRSRSYQLRMSLRRGAVASVLVEQRWPDGWVAAVIDQNMAIVARSRDEPLFVGKPATESAQQLIRSEATGVSFAFTKDGTEVATALARVPGTPWWLIAGLPRRALDDAVAGPFRAMAGFGVVIVLAGLAASVALSRYLNREVAGAVEGGVLAAPRVQEFGFLHGQRLMVQNDLVGMVRLVERRSVWHNPAFERIFGYGADELQGHSPRLMHLSDSAFEGFGRRAYAAISAGERFREPLEMLRKDGSRIWVDVSGVGLPDGSTLWMLLDITAQRAESERMVELAFHDALTGLPNRLLFEDRGRQSLAAALRDGGTVAVALLDLDGFKPVNDTFGHAAGDLLLRAIARRLQGCVRASDTVARLGGDEYVVLLPQIARHEEVEVAVERFRAAIAEPVVLDGRPCAVAASIGVALFPQDGGDLQTLLRRADERMYADKSRRKGGPAST